MGDPVVLTGICHTFRGAAVPALAGVTLSLPPSALTMVLGPNGCGKSTLLRVLAGDLQADAGGVTAAGGDPPNMAPGERARRIGWLPQDDAGHMPFTVRELVRMGRHAWRGWSPLDDARGEAHVAEALDAVGASAFADRRPAELSGGERQRAWLASALVAGPRLLVLDEPATHLDPRHQVDMWRCVRSLVATRGCTVVAVSHDVHMARSFADHVVLMRGGRVVEAGSPAAALDPAHLRAAFDLDFVSLSGPAGRTVVLPDV